MASYSDSASDLDEELPTLDFLLSGRRSSRSDGPCSTGLLAPSSSASLSSRSSLGRGDVGTHPVPTDVMLISSDSDDDAPYVPLAQRLQQRRDDAVQTSSSVVKGKVAEPRSPPTRTPLQLSWQNQFSGSHLHHLTTAGGGFWEELGDLTNLPLVRPRSDDSPAKKTAAKRTAGEIQISREEVPGRSSRQAREAVQRDKEALRQEQERQKAERRALAEAVKALRPEECIKYMVVAVDPALLQLEGGGTLLAAVQALGCSCAIEKQALPRSVGWARRAPCAQKGEGACVPEANVVMQMTADDFITLIHGYIQEERHRGSAGGPTLTTWVQERQRQHPDRILSLAVVELDKYFKSQKAKNQKRFRDAVNGGKEAKGGKARKRGRNAGAEELPEVSRVEVEEAVVHLQLHTGVSVRFLSTWQDFSNHIAMTTKAIAEAPFKREREKTGFSFHLESEWAGGQRVDKAGKGLLQVWKRQIQQFHRVSPDMAAAMLAAYPSPQLLKKAYSECMNEWEKASLLSELLVRRGEGVTSTTRRVGPELSKRLHLLMNSHDPEQTLDSSH